MPISKKRMLFEYKTLNELTGRVQEFCVQNFADNLLETMKKCAKPKKEGGGCSTVKTLASLQDKIKLVENPPFQLIDSTDWMIYNEKRLLGVAITAHSTDSAQSDYVCDTSCKDFINGKRGRMTFLVEIKAAKQIQTKKGDSMAFLTIEDNSCSLSDVVCFSKEWEKFSEILIEGSIVVLIAEKDTKKGGLIVKEVVSV